MALFKQQSAYFALAAVLLLPGSLCAEVLVVTAAHGAPVAVGKDQLCALFTGKTTLIMGASAAIPIDQPESSALREEFYSKVANKSVSQVKAGWTRLYFTGRGSPPREVSGSEEVKKILNSVPGAIGYIERASLDASVKVLFVTQ